MKLIKIRYILLPLLFVNGIIINAQGSAGEGASIESRYIVDMPTAGVIAKGNFTFSSLFFPGGGVMADISAAPFSNFNMGISFSGSNIIGNGEVVWQKLPGVSLKFRFLDEKDYLPAFAFGLSTEGRGFFHKDAKRFERLSPGVFLSFSKNYKYFLGAVAIHGGINYSFEPDPSKRVPNFYIGLEHSIGKIASVNMEYNPNIDDKDKAFYNQNGLLNMSLRISIVSGLTVELQARDLMENMAESRGFTRFIGFEYASGY